MRLPNARLMLVAAVVLTVAALAFLALRDGDEAPASTTSTTADPGVPATQLSAQYTIAELLPLDTQHSRFLELATEADLLDLLERDEVTVLVPPPEAWEDYDGSVPEDDADAIERLVRRHILEGNVTTADLMVLDGLTVTDLNGDELRVSIDGARVSVGGAAIAKPNIAAANGTIHVMSAVVPEPQD